jgi:hypothetical protein
MFDKDVKVFDEKKRVDRNINYIPYKEIKTELLNMHGCLITIISSELILRINIIIN